MLRFAAVVPLLALALAVAMLLRAPPAQPHGDFCYLQGDYNHRLTWVALDDPDPRTNETTIGPTRLTKDDAIALQHSTGALFGVDSRLRFGQAYLGTFDLARGTFRPLPQPIGTGYGRLGEIVFHDISGLAFDPATGWLYASHIETGIGVPDALLRLDPATGRFVPQAFSGADYAPLYPLPAYPQLWDVDDIAIDPLTGQMYGIINRSQDGDRLVRIDKTNGATSDVGPFGIAEVEGLDFDAQGRLWATAGGAPTGDPANALYAVDKTTGAASGRRPLDNSGNYEAVACVTGQ